MIYKLCDGSSECLIDLFSSDRNWQVARHHFVQKGYRGKYLLIGETKTGFRVWNVDLREPHGKGGFVRQRLIPVEIYTENGLTEQFYTEKDIIRERNELRIAAFEKLSRSPTERRVVYYADERDENDTIVRAKFYYQLPVVDDVYFQEWADEQKGFVGAVHRA